MMLSLNGRTNYLTKREYFLLVLYKSFKLRQYLLRLAKISYTNNNLGSK